MAKLLKRETLLTGGLVVAVMAVVGAMAWTSASKPAAQPPIQNQPVASKKEASPACRLFTLADATAVLGAGTKDSSEGGAADVTSTDATITVCRYTLAINKPEENGKTVLVLVRQAKTPAGASYNKTMFGSARPQDVQNVPGVGEAAFWDANLSELSVLKGETWYILGNMDGPEANSGTLDTSLAIYRQIKDDL